MSVHLDGIQRSFGLPWLLVPCGTAMVMFSADWDEMGAHVDLVEKANSTLRNERDAIDVWQNSIKTPISWPSRP